MPSYIGLDRIDAIVRSDPAEWWQIAAALAPLLSALLAIAFFSAWYLLIQRRKPEPWNRIQQALDMALDERPEKRSTGLAMLDQLSASHVLREVDPEIIAEARATLRKQ